nr:MAG TPA: hypothetical protein [Caudoviricetes sp.]
MRCCGGVSAPPHARPHRASPSTGAAKNRLYQLIRVLGKPSKRTIRRRPLQLPHTPKNLSTINCRRRRHRIQLLTEPLVSITASTRLRRQRVQNQVHPVLNRRHIIPQIRPMIIRRLLRRSLSSSTDSSNLRGLGLTLRPRPRPTNQQPRRQPRHRHHKSRERVDHLSIPPPRSQQEPLVSPRPPDGQEPYRCRQCEGTPPHQSGHQSQPSQRQRPETHPGW